MLVCLNQRGCKTSTSNWSEVHKNKKRTLRLMNLKGGGGRNLNDYLSLIEAKADGPLLRQNLALAKR